MRYENPREWAVKWFSPRVARPGRKWCADWESHLDVVTRMDALWLSWENADATEGLAVGAALTSWWLNQADPTCRYFDEAFAQCNGATRCETFPGPLAESSDDYRDL